jgi:hypothetical protein
VKASSEKRRRIKQGLSILRTKDTLTTTEPSKTIQVSHPGLYRNYRTTLQSCPRTTSQERGKMSTTLKPPTLNHGILHLGSHEVISRTSQLELDEQDRHSDHAIASTCRLIVGRPDRFILKCGFFVGANEILTCIDPYDYDERILDDAWYVVPRGFSVSRECLVRKFQCQLVRTFTTSGRNWTDIFILRTNYESNDWLEISFGKFRDPWIPTITYYETGEPGRFLPMESLETLCQGKTQATLLQFQQPIYWSAGHLELRDKAVFSLVRGFDGAPLVRNGKAVGE